MFGEVVEGVPADVFEDALTPLKADGACSRTPTSTPTTCGSSSTTFRQFYREHTGDDFPTDPREQLRRAVDAVFRSWQNPRAAVYRRANGIPDDLGTAVNVMQMVFGNLGDTSATGVCFTRNPSTGEKELYGEFLLNAQGEDVVAGIRTPGRSPSMGTVLPDAYAELLGDDGAARGALRRHAGHRVHDRARHALPAADAHRQAHRAGRDAQSPRPRRRGRDRPRRGAAAHRPRPSSTSCCTR